MSYSFQKINFLLILLAFSSIASSQNTNSEFWPEIKQEAKPWTRWWWMGSAVDQENINRLMKKYAENGIGGVEITPIYGVKGEEEKFIDFLSPEWIEMLSITTKAAQKNDLGVDMNTGTGWPFGGPTISDEYAAKQMSFQSLGKYSIEGVQNYISKVQDDNKVDLLALSAFNSSTRINLLEEGNLNSKINNEELEVLAVTQSNTRQMVKRAAPGGEGLIFNHFSEAATKHYLSRFDDSFDGDPGVRSFFNDSYELKSASASSELFESFESLKGYDLALYAKELSGRGNIDDIARIKADYRDVLFELLLQNFTLTWNKWATKNGAKTKNQAHGSPGNLIDLYAAVDIAELETFHATDFPFLQDYIDQSDAKPTESNHLFKKFASSAAHQTGKNLVSCETFTWLNEHFKTPLYQCKAELDELFIKGVNHLFFHGTTYSPKSAPWPGWLFYAAIHIEPNNPQWEHSKAMNEYIARCQSILQTGKHTNDFLVFWSPDDYFHDADTLQKELTLHNSEEWIHMPEIDNLLEKGYQFDFTSDRIISKEMEVQGGKILTYEQAEYKAIVFPHLDRINLSTFENVLQFAKEGATVIFRNLPQKVTGYKNYKKQEEKLKDLISSLNFMEKGALQVAEIGKGKFYVGSLENALNESSILRETLIDHSVKHISRQTENGFYYFLSNHEEQRIDKWLSFKHSARNAVIMDPMNGSVFLAESDFNNFHIQLEPGASRFIYFTNENVPGIKERPKLREGLPIVLTGPWKFQSIRGGPEMLDDQILKEPQYWTKIDKEKGQYFSGTCTYSTSFTIDINEADRFLLRLDKVEASAKVYINNQELETLWSFPFEVELGGLIKNGENTIRIEVSNLGANRIRYLDKKGINWKKFYNINIVNLDYDPLKASDWQILPSGLSGKVELIPLLR